MLHLRNLCLAALTIAALALPAATRAADEARITSFLEITGFNVALDSIGLTARAAPDMLGMEVGTYGADWRRLSDQVFDPALMRRMGVGMLAATLKDELLDHGAAFYASPLGARLVAAENASHMDDSAGKDAVGRRMVADMEAAGDGRLDLLRRMNTAIDPEDRGLQAIQEVQIRFLLAAAGSGVVRLQMDEADMRAAMKAQEEDLRAILDANALANAAFTYRDFSDADLRAYAQALEHPDMAALYQLMNAVQYEIMANRFEVLAGRMADLHPGQDL